MNEYTIELEARPNPQTPDWVPTDTFETNVAVLLTLLEGEGSFRGPVLSVSPDGAIRVLGQIEAGSIDAALFAGRQVYTDAFNTVFGKHVWTVVAAAEFKPGQAVESIPTQV